MENSHVTHLVELLSFVAKQNASHKSCSNKTVYASSVPEPLIVFMRRLNTYVRCSPSCYAVALLYIDRLVEQNTDITLTVETVNLLFATSLLIANQYLDDQPERALQFARLASVDPVAMAHLKTDFLFRIRFNLKFSDSELCAYSDRLCGPLHTEGFNSLWRGYSKHHTSSDVSDSSLVSQQQH